MIKRIFVVLALIFSLNTLVVNASMSNIEDNTNTFSSSKISTTLEEFRNLEQSHNIPIFVYTTDEKLGNRVRDIADGLLRDRVGAGNDGVLLLIDYYHSEIYITFSGRAIQIIDDKRRDELLDSLYPHVRNNPDFVLTQFSITVNQYIQSGPKEGVRVVDEKELTYTEMGVGVLAGIGGFILNTFNILNKNKTKYAMSSFSLIENSSTAYSHKNDKLINTTTAMRNISLPVYGSSRNSNRSGSRPVTTTHRSSGGGNFGGGGRKF